MADNLFWDRGYIVLPDFIDAQQVAFVRAAMDVSHRTGKMGLAPKVNPNPALNEYSPVGAEALLLQCRTRLEIAVGRALTPSYAYWRIYLPGAALPRHFDRDACEVSASLAIAGLPAEPGWPLHVRDLQGEEAGYALRPGDAIIYQGCRVQHWREPFTGERQYQVFLHYVLEDGDRTGHAFDQRSALKIDGGGQRLDRSDPGAA